MIGGWWRAVAEGVASGRLGLIGSKDLLAETADALARPRIARLIPTNDAGLFLRLYARTAVFYDVGPNPKICRDPRDDFLLALADASQAEMLVTRDEDLLVLGHHGVTEIIYPARFHQLLGPVAPPERP